MDRCFLRLKRLTTAEEVARSVVEGSFVVSSLFTIPTGFPWIFLHERRITSFQVAEILLDKFIRINALEILNNFLVLVTFARILFKILKSKSVLPWNLLQIYPAHFFHFSRVDKTINRTNYRNVRYSWPSSILRNSPCSSYSASSLLGPGAFLFRFTVFRQFLERKGETETRVAEGLHGKWVFRHPSAFSSAFHAPRFSFSSWERYTGWHCAFITVGTSVFLILKYVAAKDKR